MRVVLAKTGEELKITAEQQGPQGLTDSDIERIVEIDLTDDKSFGGSTVGWLFSELTDVEVLKLDGTGVTDNELPPLTAMTGLKQLSLRRTKVTAAGFATLQKALPNCKIEWDGADRRVASSSGTCRLGTPIDIAGVVRGRYPSRPCPHAGSCLLVPSCWAAAPDRLNRWPPLHLDRRPRPLACRRWRDLRP